MSEPDECDQHHWGREQGPTNSPGDTYLPENPSKGNGQWYGGTERERSTILLMLQKAYSATACLLSRLARVKEEHSQEEGMGHE